MLVGDISNKTGVSVYEYLFTVRENTWPRQISPVTGWILAGILLIMVLTSLPVMRRTGNFEVFFYFHQLYILFYIVLIFHAPKFWYWFALPGTLYCIEMFVRIARSFGSHGYTYIAQGTLLPSRVVHLVIKRPPNFNFSPGDFVYIQIPDVAKTEWHPFTISSAPEMSDYLWLHIRAVGEWTNRVYDYFLEKEKEMSSKSLCDGNNHSHVVTFNSQTSQTSQNGRLKRGRSYPPLPGADVRPSLNRTFSTVDSGVDVRPPLNRTFSTVDPRVRIPFDRKQSKIYVLPRPADCDEYCVRRKRNIVSRKETTKATSTSPSQGTCTTGSAVNKEVRVTIPEEGKRLLRAPSSQSRTRANSEDSSKISGRIIKLDKPLRLHIDGPFGSASSHIFRTEHAVLIATGIGITPFASILQSIMFRYMKAKHTCPSCSYSWSDSIPPNTMNLKKVDFVWINRHQKSFEWFVSLLSELEVTQAMLNESDRFLDIHTYITSALDKTDMKAIGLRLALDLMHEKEQRDLITGLKTRTHPGRPNWHSLFTELANQKKGRVTIFFCGPPALGRIVQSHCIPFGFAFKKENF